MIHNFKHKISIVVEGKEIPNWIDYEIHSSMITPADTFTLRRAWDADAWNALPRDAEVRVTIDGVTILRGFIDHRKKRARDGTIEVHGRDRAGRLTQESAPAINYDGLSLTDAVLRLVEPWFKKVTLSDARNRFVRRGKGHRVGAGNEPVIIRTPTARGRVHPGQMRWAVIEEICAQAGLVAWSSADGTEFFIGKPNYSQAAQFLFVHAKQGSKTLSTVDDMEYLEDNGDRYSLISVVGSGGGTDDDFGESVSTRRATVYDNEDILKPGEDPFDGTGRDFIYPKRLLMPEKDFTSNGDAERVAQLEQKRRDFKRTHLVVEFSGHGQFVTTESAITIFAPNTIARVIDEEFEPAIDDPYLIYSCSFRGSRTTGATTQLELVPKDTDIVL